MSFLTSLGLGSKLTSGQHKAIKDATSMKPFGPYEHEMKEIASMTSERQNYHDVIDYLDMKLQKRQVAAERDCWRTLYKSLVLLEYILVSAPREVTRDYYLHRIDTAKGLRSWKYNPADKQFTREDTFVNSKAIDIFDFLVAEHEGKNTWQSPIMAAKSIRRPQAPSRPQGDENPVDTRRQTWAPSQDWAPAEYARDPYQPRPTRSAVLTVPPSASFPTHRPSQGTQDRGKTRQERRGDDDIDEDLAKALELSKLDVQVKKPVMTPEERDIAEAIRLSMREEKARQRKATVAQTSFAVNSNTAGPSTSTSPRTPFAGGSNTAGSFSLIDLLEQPDDNPATLQPPLTATSYWRDLAQVQAQQHQATLQAKQEELAREQVMMQKQKAEWAEHQEEWEKRRQLQKQQDEEWRKQQQLRQKQQEQWEKQQEDWAKRQSMASFPSYSQATASSSLSPLVLELGSKNPFARISSFSGVSSPVSPTVDSTGAWRASALSPNSEQAEVENPFAEPENSFDYLLSSQAGPSFSLPPSSLPSADKILPPTPLGYFPSLEAATITIPPSSRVPPVGTQSAPTSAEAPPPYSF